MTAESAAPSAAVTSPPAGSPGRHLPWYARPAARSWTCPPAPAEVAGFHRKLPRYAPTPLTALPALAQELGVGRVFVKDESTRFGLAAFKALGASWAIHQVLSRRAEGRPVLLVTATAGNHGRAVARMARVLGGRAHVFVPEGVHPGAVTAIAAEGARITRVAGPYDEAVRRAAASCDGYSRVLVQDTAWPGYERVPGWIVEGYSTLFREIDEQLKRIDGSSVQAERAEAGPTGLVAVPAGVGSLAQAAVTHYRSGPEGSGTALLSVEPESAAGVLTSLARRRRVAVTAGATAMAGLNCGTPSAIAWPFLRDGLDAAVAVTDAEVSRAAHDLTALGVPLGPCGAASLAGVRAALTGDGSAERRARLAVGPTTTVVLLGTEGAAVNPGAGQG